MRIIVFVVAFHVVGIAAVLDGQARPGRTVQTPAAQEEPKVEIPKLDDDDTLVLQALQTIATIANSECEALQAVRLYQEQRRRTVARIEEKYPCCTINLAEGQLIAKPKGD